MRNTILSVYQPSYLAKLVSIMQSYIESATKNHDSEGNLTCSDLSLKLATDVIGQASFGVDFGLSKPNIRQDKSSSSSRKNPGYYGLKDGKNVQEFKQ